MLGLPSGIMDQLASAASVAGAASLIDCRTLSITPVELPPDTDVVIMDTGTRRQLVDSPRIDRLNLGAIPTIKLDWLQPHEGNIVDFLYRTRALQKSG